MKEGRIEMKGESKGSEEERRKGGWKEGKEKEVGNERRQAAKEVKEGMKERKNEMEREKVGEYGERKE